MATRVLEASLWVPRSPDEIFPFFAAAENLDHLTPPWLGFEIRTPLPVAMAVGTTIDYRIRVHGLPLRWRTRISLWQPPHAFADEQLLGPYRQWQHLHTFRPENGGTRLSDRVVFRAPGGPFEPLLYHLLVKRDVSRIFEFRMEKMRELFGAPPDSGSLQLAVA